MDYSLVENLKWLRENKTAFLEQLNKILPEDSGLTVEDSWDTIAAFISNLQTDYVNLEGGAEEQMERFLNDSIETAISVSSPTINPYTFYNKASLKKIKADSATSIGNYAFSGCTGLTEISAESVTKIGNHAFEGCTSLAHISMPAITYMDSYAFHNTALTNLDWLDTSKITYIGMGAFNGCTQLSGDLLLNCAATIDSQAFAYCKSLERIIITTDVTEVNKSLVYTGRTDTGRPDGYALKYIACEQASKPSTWSSTWNRVTDSSLYYQWPTYWNASVKDWVFVYNNDKEDSYWTGRVLEEFPNEGTKEGYKFRGWYSDKELATAVTVPLTVPDSIPCLYAKWVKACNVIVIDMDNKKQQIDMGMFELTSMDDLPTTKRLGYEVLGWYIDADMTIELTDLAQVTDSAAKIYAKGQAPNVIDFSYTGEVQTVNLTAGTYELECWGAQGGGEHAYFSSTTASLGGCGGYSYGTLTLADTTVAYIYVGGLGGCSNRTKKDNSSSIVATGGFNGGGGATQIGMNGGGGGSDIRLLSDSLYSRLIVAGGGGGGGNASNTTLRSNGGPGGGLTGITMANSTQFSYRTAGSGGTQTTGHAFGVGQTGNTQNLQGGGGGGWYGGNVGDNSTGGGGGSGYVYTSATAANYPSGCLLSSNYYLTDAETITGNQEIVAPDGSTETGHAGNGYVRITKVKA